MRRTPWLLAAGMLLLVGCRKESALFKTYTVAQAAEAIGKGATPVDANGNDFREKNGVIANAILLEKYKDYDPGTVLPPDKNAALVFYCSNSL